MGILLGIWIYTLTSFSSLPKTIPIHYNLEGKADDFGDKLNLLQLPIVSTIIYIGLTVLNKYPHMFNYPVSLTKANMLRQYTIATKMIRILKIMILLIFGFIIFQTICNSQGYEGGGLWLTPLFLIMIFVPIIYYLIASSKSS